MVDIFLELPNNLIKDYERRAARLGKTAEDLMREAIESNAPASDETAAVDLGPLDDEPIVKAAEIENEYRRLGYSYGWRFITCPQANAATAKLVLVSLNPAGREVHGPPWSQERGNAYRVEAWGGLPTGQAPLQRQVQHMFALLGLSDEQVFSAHYVPFRSPSWEALDRRTEAEAFARRLWKWLSPKLSFERLICIGKNKPGRPIADVFQASFETSLPVGWGSVTADRYRLPDGRPLIALPHLSRFGIFGRKEGKRALEKLFEL